MRDFELEMKAIKNEYIFENHRWWKFNYVISKLFHFSILFLLLSLKEKE